MKKPFYVVAAPDAVADVRWQNARGDKIRPAKVVAAAEAYLESSGAMAGLPDSNHISGGITLKEAPYQFTIVSVDPVVVLMTPVTSPPAVRRSYGLPTRKLKNWFWYGPRLPFHSQLLWFSPDMQLGPEEAETISEDIRLVRLPAGTIRAIRVREEWVTVRE